MDAGMDGSQGTVPRYPADEVDKFRQPELRKVCGKENLPMKHDGKYLGVTFPWDSVLAVQSDPGAQEYQRYDPFEDKWLTVATRYGEGPIPKKGKRHARSMGSATPSPTDPEPPLGVHVKREVDTPAVARPHAHRQGR